MGFPDLQNTGEIPMPLKIVVQSLSRIVFTTLVPLLSKFLIKQMYSGIDTHIQIHRCPGRLTAEVPSLLLSACPTISSSHALFLPL